MRIVPQCEKSRIIIVLIIMLGLTRPVWAVDASPISFFEKKIRPILIKHCYECHGPDEASGKLRLDSKSGWQRGGEAGPAIIPGDAAGSLLIKAVSYKDAKLRMPPPDAGGKLSDREVADLVAWIRGGAHDPRTGNTIVRETDVAAREHWAFQPVTPPVVPAGQHPVDFLVNKQLKAANFTSTSLADAYTLARRATFDLHGLPPSSDQLKSAREDFPSLIKQLLKSPRYGERWGRHWLDVARYSDAKDGVLMYGNARIRPFAYTYRDYVIRAFNDNKPFDQFIREQLAADQLLLPEDSPNLAAMGLLTLGRMFDNNRHDVIDDQIDVITRGFLGLTVSCARCHDHKFDPVPTADYYSLYGIFASSIEPYKRPRIGQITEAGKAYETELQAKLNEVYKTQNDHYTATTEEARKRTPDYLAAVATTEPDVMETTIFFFSLLPEQLRPQITYRWRQLIARRAFPDDPIFGPWHDMMQRPVLKVAEWEHRGIDQRVIDGLVAATPKTPEQIARAYGEIIRAPWVKTNSIKEQIARLYAELDTLDGGAINVSEIVAGGNGYGSGKRGHGIHPVTGKPTTGETGMIEVTQHDTLIPVPSSKFVDGVFVPKSSTSTISSTGLKINDLVPGSGTTWDYIKYGPSAGFTVNTINGVDYSAAPNWMMAMHANKGITFDIKAFRNAYEFGDARFKTLFGHGGKQGDSDLDFAVYVDGKRVVNAKHFAAQQAGLNVDVTLPTSARFLTLVVTEGGKGLSHDQAILGNPRIVPDKNARPSQRRMQRIANIKTNINELELALGATELTKQDPFYELLYSRRSPLWFPKSDIYHYLSRKQKDDYRGLVNQLDSISVNHSNAAPRAMVMVDAEQLYDPVIFQRGDPVHRGNPVPRQFLEVLSPKNRAAFANGSGRLDLANAIASTDNPLTARVWVNRVWMHHFGEPLAENPSDFGLRTKQPIQHELLDYLATYLIQNGWRTKALHELIMTSDAYQRASLIPESNKTQQQLESDPTNKLIWHAIRRRLDFEQMRDTILFVSGQLDSNMYGRPPLIVDANNKRRTVYAFVERQNIPSIVQTFDFANADTSTSRRVNTTVPQQALFAMNAPFMASAAEALVNRLEEGSTNDRIGRLHSLVFGREPQDDEADLFNEFLKTNTLQQLAQVFLMSNELMFVD